MRDKIHVGIFGAGWVSAEHLKAWKNNPRCEVVAMGSRRAEQVKQRLIEAGVDGKVEICASLEKILQRKDIDVISICLPAYLQAEAAMLAAEAGKHLLVEKPIAKTIAELKQLRDVVCKAGVKTVVGFVLRWNPMVQIVKNLIREGWLGKIIYGRFAYLHELGPWYSGYAWARTQAMGGSVTLLGGCHAIDVMRYLVDDEAAEAVAFSTRGHRFDFEYDPTIVGLVRFKNGAVGQIAASQELHMPYLFPMEIMGSLGAIRDGKIWSEKTKGQTGWANIPSIMPDSGDVSHHPFQGEIDHLVDCILNNKESHASVADSVKTHEIVFAMDDSAAESGRPVKLPLI